LAWGEIGQASGLNHDHQVFDALVLIKLGNLGGAQATLGAALQQRAQAGLHLRKAG